MENQTPAQSGEQINQAPVNPPHAKTPFYRHPILGIILVIVVVALSIGYVVTQAKPKQETAQTTEYETGLSKDLINIQTYGVYKRYPLSEFVIGSVDPNLTIFEGLTIYRGNTLEPGLAESWTNPDPTTWRLKLRNGVKFQSGDLFTAKDVKYTIEQAKASEKAKTPWVSQAMAARVDSVQIIDDYTIDLKTKEPDATLLSWLVYMGIVSKDQVTRDGVEKAVGTGPYKLASFNNESVNLEAFNDYWAGAPKAKKIVYKLIDDPEKAKKALNDGAVDIINLNTVDNKELEGKGYQFANLRSGLMYFLTLDVNSAKSKFISTDKNPLKDVRVRKAIELSLDIPKIISDAHIDAEPVTQFATPELVGFNPAMTRPSKNIEEAKKLLTEAGFPNGFTTTLDVEDLPASVKIVEGVQKQLAEVGIIIKPNPLKTEEFIKVYYSGNYGILLGYYYPDTRDALDFIDTLFHEKVGSHGLYNWSNYSNPKVNSLIDQAESTFDETKRIELTHQAQDLIIDELASIPLLTVANQIFARDDVSYKTSISLIILGYDVSGRQKVTK